MPVLSLAASVGQRYCRRLWGCVVVGDGVVDEVALSMVGDLCRICSGCLGTVAGGVVG